MGTQAQIGYSEPTSVLLVDENVLMRHSLCSSLSARGYAVGEAQTRDEALRLIARKAFDLVFLDVNTTDREAWLLIRELRPNIGMIMLASHDSEEDTVHALDSGADDYIVKPFRFGELLARMRALARRVRVAEPSLHAEPSEASGGSLAGRFELDFQLRVVKKRTGERARLSPKEFSLLVYLMERPGITIGHRELLRGVWGAAYENEIEYLRAYIRLLRRKIENDSAHPEYIITEPQLGYRFQNRQFRSKERRPRLPERVGYMNAAPRATGRIL